MSVPVSETARKVQCPDPNCTGAVSARPLALLADPAKHPLAPLVARMSFPDQSSIWPMISYVIGLVVSPFVFSVLGWWAAPLYAVIVLGFVTQGIFLLASPSAGKLHLVRYRCKKCKYSWTRTRSPRSVYIERLEWEVPRARKGGNRQYLALLLSDMGGMLVTETGDVAGAIPMLEESLSIRREVPNKRALAYVLNNLAFALIYAGQEGRSRQLCEESLGLFRELKEWMGIASASNTLANALLRTGEVDRAKALFDESLLIKWRMIEPELIAWDLEGLAQVAAHKGEPVKAARLIAAASGIRSENRVPLMQAAAQRVQTAMDWARSALGEAQFASAWAEGRRMNLDQACDYALYARDVVPVFLPADMR